MVPWVPVLSWLGSPEEMLTPYPGVSQLHPASFSPSIAGSALPSRRQPVTCCHPGTSSSTLPTICPGHGSSHLIRLHKPFQGSAALLGSNPNSEHRRPIASPLPSSCPLLPPPQQHRVAPGMRLLFHAPGTLHVLIPLLGIHSPPPSHISVIHGPQHLPLPQQGPGTPSMCHSITVQ